MNWFPHISPDGQQILFLSFPPGTTGHPPNLPIELKLAGTATGAVRTLIQMFGGQGTCNVNSWAPDSARFAYVSYPIGRQTENCQHKAGHSSSVTSRGSNDGSIRAGRCRFIGAGMISDTYLENLTSFPDVRVVILGDLDQQRAQTQAEKYDVPQWGSSDDV